MLGCCILAVPAASFYGVPELVWFLPVAGTTAMIYGLLPTKIETANRHLQMGRLTIVELATAAVTTIITIGLAAMLEIGLGAGDRADPGVGGQGADGQLLDAGPGKPFRWDPDCVAELVRFGKWIMRRPWWAS